MPAIQEQCLNQLQHVIVIVADGGIGVLTKGKNPSWKCISTISGYHTRPIYDVRWSVCNSL